MKGIVLAGGASSRFGGKPKGLASLRGRAMALRVADTLLTVCESVAIEAPRGVGYEALGLPLIHAPPECAGKGPLAALLTGLRSVAEGRVAFAACDMPLLTREIYDRLAQASQRGAYARTPLGAEPLVAILHTDLREAMVAALARETLPRTHMVLDAAGAQAVDFVDPAPFSNVNTPYDLAQMELIVR